jgi:hypothetical protein
MPTETFARNKKHFMWGTPEKLLDNLYDNVKISTLRSDLMYNNVQDLKSFFTHLSFKQKMQIIFFPESVVCMDHIKNLEGEEKK